MLNPSPPPSRTGTDGGGREPVASNEILIRCADDNILTATVHGRPNPVRVIVSHGNGMASDGYRVFWRHLVTDFEVVVLDLRGHGRSGTTPPEHHQWNYFDDDMDRIYQQISRALGEKPTYGAFHSLSSIVGLRHLRKYGKSLDGMVLFDPPLTPPVDHPLYSVHLNDVRTLGAKTAQRRELFNDPEELAQQFKKASFLGQWVPAAYADMAYAVLRKTPAPDSDWRLVCPAACESRIFEGNVDGNPWEALANPALPIKLICGDPTLESSGTPALLGREAHLRLNVAYEYLPNSTHFLQLEYPELCAQKTMQFIRNHIG